MSKNSGDEDDAGPALALNGALQLTHLVPAVDFCPEVSCNEKKKVPYVFMFSVILLVKSVF